MDTAARSEGVWIIRPLRDAELKCIETMLAMLAKHIIPIVIYHQTLKLWVSLAQERHSGT